MRCKKRKKSGWQSVHTAFWLAFLLCVGTLWPGAFAEAASDVQETTWQEEAAQGVEKDSCLKMHILDVGQAGDNMAGGSSTGSGKGLLSEDAYSGCRTGAFPAV